VLVASVVPFMLKTDDNTGGTEQSVFDGMAKGMSEDRAKFFAGFFKDFFGVSMLSHPVSQELMDWARGMAMQASLKATLECAKSFASTDFRPDLAAFTKPTLVIHGTEDQTVPIEASGRAAARAIKQSTLIEYAGAPHGLFATHKARLSSDLLAFVRT
jgi:non-heme chloroperoxidase